MSNTFFQEGRSPPGCCWLISNIRSKIDCLTTVMNAATCYYLLSVSSSPMLQQYAIRRSIDQE